MDTKDLSRDSSGTRAYAAFLLELSRCVPDVMLPSISVLLVLLDGEVSNLDIEFCNISVFIAKQQGIAVQSTILAIAILCVCALCAVIVLKQLNRL